MKKYGFTLAEVLITLAIIGVVATLTLPALMTNTQEQQAKTALKKGINTLTEAAQMHAAIDGFDYGSITSNDTEETEGKQSLYALLSTRGSIDFKKSGKSKSEAKWVSHQGSSADVSNDSNFTVFFRDGSSLTYSPEESIKKANQEIQEDGLPKGIPAILDTNGDKGPNIVSNCQGVALGATQDEVESDKTYADYCTKKQRVIKDQFGVSLRGGYAFPNGAAAQWAFNN